MGMGWPQQLDDRLDGPRGKRLAVGGGAKGRPAATSYAGAGEPKILSKIARLAYRRPATPADEQTVLQFFSQGRREGGSFDAGIQFALERMLVDPDFLLRVHHDRASQGPYRLTDLELASRL